MRHAAPCVQSTKKLKSLARRAQRLNIGIVVDGIAEYGRGVMRGVMQYANERRNWMIHEELRRVGLEEINWPKCDGAIVAGSAPMVLSGLIKKIPHVVHCSSSGDPTKTMIVCLDDIVTGQMAAEHLMNCRLEKFGYYGHHGASAIKTSVDRYQGFGKRLAERGFACELSPVSYPHENEWLKRKHWPRLIPWLQGLTKPIGIFCYDDMAAHDLVAACLKANIAVPEQVAIIGVNNDQLACESAWPPLSSVEGDFSRVGYRAAEMLDRILRGKKISDAERVKCLPPLGIVARQSTNVLAVDDPHLANTLRYIREHACDPCTVNDVLREVPVNRRWLERQFMQKLGRTPHDEITRVRVEHARRLMLNPTLSLDDISTHCGFLAISSFNRAFTKTMNMAPGQYRRQTQRR